VQRTLPTRDALLQLLRVYADNLERLAEAENRIFHDQVHEQFRTDGLSGRELMQASAGIGTALLGLVEPTLLYFHRRAWQRALQHDFLRHLTEDERPPSAEPGAMPCAVLFADLAGFTPLTAAMGDRAAADVLHRFGGLVRRCANEHYGRVVKQIGDAFMLVFDDKRDALRCGLRLLDSCSAEVRFPGLHIGAHAGEVLFRDGDYVGSAVKPCCPRRVGDRVRAVPRDGGPARRRGPAGGRRPGAAAGSSLEGAPRRRRPRLPDTGLDTR
jgi:adenylate cyclase